MGLYDLIEYLDEKTILEELNAYLDTDTIEDFILHYKEMYDLEEEEENDY